MFFSFNRTRILNPRVTVSGHPPVRACHPRAKTGAWCRSSGFRWLAILATAGVALLLMPDATFSGPRPAAAAQTAYAEKTPDFVLRDLNDRKFRLGDFRGKKPVLIIFTATWCTFCKDEIPRFKFIHETYAKQGLEIVNIDIQEPKDKVAKFVAKYKLPYKVLLDEDGIVSNIYGVRGVPSMVLVDSNGNIVCRQCQRVEPLIESLLKKR